MKAAARVATISGSCARVANVIVRSNRHPLLIYARHDLFGYSDQGRRSLSSDLQRVESPAETPYAAKMKSKVQARALPETAFLSAYRDKGAYTDCLTLDVEGSVSLEQYVTAFYTSTAFRPERAILSRLLGMHSSDDDAARLGAGTIDRFAAWTVEQRSADQILLCDYQSRTRSWLMIVPLDREGGGAATRLHFGSAVTQIEEGRAASAFARFMFWALLWFHKLYARFLLEGAGKSLAQLGGYQPPDEATRHPGGGRDPVPSQATRRSLETLGPSGSRPQASLEFILSEVEGTG
jgi:hypothetical protein